MTKNITLRRIASGIASATLALAFVISPYAAVSQKDTGSTPEFFVKEEALAAAKYGRGFQRAWKFQGTIKDTFTQPCEKIIDSRWSGQMTNCKYIVIDDTQGKAGGWRVVNLVDIFQVDAAAGLITTTASSDLSPRAFRIGLLQDQNVKMYFSYDVLASYAKSKGMAGTKQLVFAPGMSSASTNKDPSTFWLSRVVGVSFNSHGDPQTYSMNSGITSAAVTVSSVEPGDDGTAAVIWSTGNVTVYEERDIVGKVELNDL